MAIIAVDTAKRSIYPGLFNLKQYLNGTETIMWEFSENTTNDGEVTLDDYDVSLVLSSNGVIDEVMLSKQNAGGKLRAVWNVGDYATELTGHVLYQIVFKSSQFDTIGVLSDNTGIKGTYKLIDINTFGTDRVFRKDNGYLVKWDTTNLRWGLYNGSQLLDYQTVAHQEPYGGRWENVAVGNVEAAAWFSNEAVMQVSDSIAADQSVSAGFPTILRQLWARMSKSGVVSVNGKSGEVTVYASDIGAADKEHKHAISDINNLQVTINGKANTGHGHAISDVSGLQSALDGKLSLAGGTLTGTIRSAVNGALYRADDTHYLVVGGGSAFDNGALLYLYGKGDTTGPGYVVLAAKDGSKAQYLYLTPSGSATWCGKNLVRSVNGVNADTAGNVTINISNISGLQTELTNIYNTNVAQGNAIEEKLPKSGGTMTGGVTFTNGEIAKRNSNDGFLQILGGTVYTDGAYIRLDGKGGPNKGSFTLCAGDGSTRITLNGTPAGGLTWDGKNVVCVTSWRSGANWYRKYSDGFIEQGGELTSGTDGNRTVTLNTPFTTNSYFATAQSVYGEGTEHGWDYVSSKTTTSFVISVCEGKPTWYACGY